MGFLYKPAIRSVSDYNLNMIFIYIGIPTLIVLFFLFPDAPVSSNMQNQLRRVDYLGSILLITTNIIVLLATSWGGVT